LTGTAPDSRCDQRQSGVTAGEEGMSDDARENERAQQDRLPGFGVW
jgi:hypothetical protein